MRRPLLYFFILIFAMQAFDLRAQQTEKPAARFTLTLSAEVTAVDIQRRFILAVTETNISNKVIREAQCMPLTFEAGIKVSVVYNGVPLEMDEAKPAVKYIRDQDKAGRGHCHGKSYIQEAQPGGGPEGAFDGVLDISQLYDISKPGTYEITVSKETFPHDPAKSITVKSNTITIVVPEPGADAPK